MNDEISRQNLLEARKPFVTTRGIYFLFEGEEVVYVGQGQVAEARIYEHRKDKKFDSYHIIECSDGDLNDIEALYIIKFKPKYNISVPGNSRFVSMKRLKELYQTNANSIKKILKKYDITNEHLIYYDLFKVDAAMKAENKAKEGIL